MAYFSVYECPIIGGVRVPIAYSTYHHLGAASADADTQDGKDGEEKEVETYENVFEYVTKATPNETIVSRPPPTPPPESTAPFDHYIHYYSKLSATPSNVLRAH